jgi:hypothetical protein
MMVFIDLRGTRPVSLLAKQYIGVAFGPALHRNPLDSASPARRAGERHQAAWVGIATLIDDAIVAVERGNPNLKGKAAARLRPARHRAGEG